MSVNYFSMGGMMGSENMHREKDFTLLLWLCISINDTLFIPQYTSTCIDILEERVKRFMSVSYKDYDWSPTGNDISNWLVTKGKISWKETLPSSD